jgi:predicted amidohydrolase
MSMVVDPHGGVIARASAGDQVICAPYDDAEVSSYRARLPLLADLRPAAYA